MAGGVNRLYHFRKPTPLDKQNIVRMNRDTLYSMGIVDTSQGATITVPEIPKGRYVSVYLVDNDHYCTFVIYTPGKHELPNDTKYLGVGVRIKVFNPADPAEIALVNKLQDQFIIEAGSADPRAWQGTAGPRVHWPEARPWSARPRSPPACDCLSMTQVAATAGWPVANAAGKILAASGTTRPPRRVGNASAAFRQPGHCKAHGASAGMQMPAGCA